MKLIASFLLLATLRAIADDPSLKPHPDPTGKAKYSERYRILVDIDGDGTDDMLLSGGPEDSGTMGCSWTVHLNRDGGYAAIGNIWAHPMAIAFEPDQDRISKDPNTLRFARIWVYLKSSGSNGALGYYRVAGGSVDEMKSIEIYPGDGGTDLGRAIYEATFKKSPIPYRVQQSTTGENGLVTWADSKR